MTENNLKTEIIIIGAGLAGLTMAVALAKEGIEVIVIDKHKKTDFSNKKFDARSSALSYGTKEFLEQCNIWQKLKKQAGEINDILVIDQDSSLSIDFNKNLVSNQPMGYMLRNNDIYNILFAAAEKYKNLKILLETSYDKINFLTDKVTINLTNNKNIEAELLIASDGKNSYIRKLLDIKTIDKDYQQDAIICNIEHENSHKETAIERFFPSGPFAILPMIDKHQSAIVWTEKRDKAKDFLALDKIAFAKELSKRCISDIGKIKPISQPVSYPLTLKLACKYTARRTALIGDTIHGMHPIAGQGYNLAIRDIKSLLTEIINAKYTKQDFGKEEILKTYQKSRYIDSFSMAGITDFLNSLFSNNIIAIKLARRIGLTAVNQISFLKKKIVKHAMFGPRF